jgi:hypothetical protein
MSRSDELARRRVALVERAAEQRLAIASTAATLRERALALRSILSAAGVLVSAGRTLWRRWSQHRAARAAAGADAGAAAQDASPDRAGG